MDNLAPVTQAQDVPTKAWVDDANSDNQWVNGYGMFGDNTNWSYWVYRGDGARVGKGGFWTQSYGGAFADYPVAVDVGREYAIGGWVRNDFPGLRQYIAIVCKDVDNFNVSPNMGDPGQQRKGSETTLAQPWTPGDQTMVLTDASGWSEGYPHRSINLYPYYNRNGSTYDAYTYTRHSDVQQFTISGNTITLLDPNAPELVNPRTQDGSWPAGTPVMQSSSGGTYIYPWSEIINHTDWQFVDARITRFWHGTAFIQPGHLRNYNSASPEERGVTWSGMFLVPLPTGLDDKYVSKAGDTVNGSLTFPENGVNIYLGDPAGDRLRLHRSGQNQYVDYATKDLLFRAGGSASALVLTANAEAVVSRDPSQDMAVANKRYVDQGLSGKANASHAHPTSDVTGLDAALAGKAPTSHTHDDRYFTESEVTSKLAGKADTSHTHPDYMTQAQSDALYAPLDHQHDYAPAAHSHPYLPLAGGTMAGDLNFGWYSADYLWHLGVQELAGIPGVNNGDIALKNAVNADGNPIVNVPLPNEPGDAVNKDYVDNIGGQSAHGSLGGLDLDQHLQYAPIHVVEAADPAPEAHQRPGQIVVRTGTDAPEGVDFLQKQGGQMSGPLLLQGAPASELEAVPRVYVDPTGLGDTGWQSFTPYLASGWGKHSDQWEACWRLRNGWFQMRGLVVATAAPAAGAKIGTLPHPPAQLGGTGNGHHFSCAVGGAATNYVSFVRAESGGDLDIGALGGSGAAWWVSLDTVGYWID